MLYFRLGVWEKSCPRLPHAVALSSSVSAEFIPVAEPYPLGQVRAVSAPSELRRVMAEQRKRIVPLRKTPCVKHVQARGVNPSPQALSRGKSDLSTSAPRRSPWRENTRPRSGWSRADNARKCWRSFTPCEKGFKMTCLSPQKSSMNRTTWRYIRHTPDDIAK